MKKFLIKTTLFLLGIFIIDIAFGFSFEYLQANAKGGATLRDNFICKEVTSDVLILGSSRCEHHYNPIILEDSLKVTCYNAGQAGNGIIVAYARYLMMRERKEPRMVIYDISPDFDLLAGYDNHRYLTWLRSYKDKCDIREIINSIDPMEKFKMLSQMYCYNSRFIEILIDYLHPIMESDIKGYEPLSGELNILKIRRDKLIPANIHYTFDPLKIEYLSTLIDSVGNDKILFVISPIWYGMESEKFRPVVEICNDKGVRFIDFANNPKYVHNDKYFKDGTHLNSNGANEFTKDLIAEIKNNN